MGAVMADRCLFSFYETSNGQTVDWSDRVIGGNIPPYLYDDALKFTSHLRDFTGVFGTVYSGLENNADFNNECRNVKITADRWVANGGKYPFTVKGGCEGIIIEGVLDGHGTEVDVDAGNKSDQSSNWVKDWELALVSKDGSPIVVRCLLAKAPRLRPNTGPYRFAFPNPTKPLHGFYVWFYFTFIEPACRFVEWVKGRLK